MSLRLLYLIFQHTLGLILLSTAAEDWIWPTFRDRVGFVWARRGCLAITDE